MATITAGDYTVEYAIKSDNYRNWYNTEYRKPNGDFENQVSPAMSLKKYMKDIIEEELTNDLKRSPLSEAASGSVVKGHKKADGKAEMQEVKIADIVYSFKNADLIDALKIRGKFIA